MQAAMAAARPAMAARGDIGDKRGRNLRKKILP